MRKLHVKTEKGWEPVFCQVQGKILTCPDTPRKALPPLAMWAEEDLKYFQTKYADKYFALLAI